MTERSLFDDANDQHDQPAGQLKPMPETWQELLAKPRRKQRRPKRELTLSERLRKEPHKVAQEVARGVEELLSKPEPRRRGKR
jgi:hypothetical protein